MKPSSAWATATHTSSESVSTGGRPVHRNTVGRLINRLKDWRDIAARFDKTPESYLAGLELRASMSWLGDLLRAAG